MNRLAICAVALLGFFAYMPAHAALKTKTVDYQINGGTFEGYWAYDDAKKGKRPGVVMFPAFMGFSDNEKEHADRLAMLGYAVFVADVYGKGIRPTNGKDAGAESAKYTGNRPLLRERVEAGLAQLKANPMVDPNHIGVIGYCFGGASALELARDGAPVEAVVVFHANLSNPTPDNAKNIKGHILALQGADDPIVPLAAREAFEKEMRDAHVDFELVAYANTVHAYTDKHAGNDNSKGAAYNAESEKRSWIAMKDFFTEYLR